MYLNFYRYFSWVSRCSVGYRFAVFIHFNYLYAKCIFIFYIKSTAQGKTQQGKKTPAFTLPCIHITDVLTCAFFLTMTCCLLLSVDSAGFILVYNGMALILICAVQLFIQCVFSGACKDPPWLPQPRCKQHQLCRLTRMLQRVKTVNFVF